MSTELEEFHHACRQITDIAADLQGLAAALRRVGIRDAADELYGYAAALTRNKGIVDAYVFRLISQGADDAMNASGHLLAATLAGIDIGKRSAETSA